MTNSCSRCFRSKEELPLGIFIFFFYNSAISGRRRWLVSSNAQKQPPWSATHPFFPSMCKWLNSEQAAQGGYGFCILRDAQNLPGHSHKQPALVDPALCRQVGLDLQGALPTSAILWFWTAPFPHILIVFPSSHITILFFRLQKHCGTGGKSTFLFPNVILDWMW